MCGERITNRNSHEVSSNIVDTVEGNFAEAIGVAGKGLRLDEFTTRIIRIKSKCFCKWETSK